MITGSPTFAGDDMKEAAALRAADSTHDFAATAAVWAARMHDAAMAVAQRANVLSGARRAGCRFVPWIELLQYRRGISLACVGPGRGVLRTSVGHFGLLSLQSSLLSRLTINAAAPRTLLGRRLVVLN